MGDDNPFHYRGYYYDTDTGLYYLNSRYYSPEFGRFISADVFVSTGQGLTGNNMFAYCNNNPVNRTDEGGNISNVAIGAIVGGVIGLFSAVARGESARNVIIATAAGAITGVLCAMGPLGILAGSALNGVATGLTTKGTTKEKVVRGAVIVCSIPTLMKARTAKQFQ